MTRPGASLAKLLASPRALLVCLALVAASAGSGAGAQAPSADDGLHRAIFEELVEIDTSPAGGGVSRAARAVETRLAARG